jgi:acyl-CoA thioesterase-1
VQTMRRVLTIAFLALLAGCAVTPGQRGGDILIAGDSVLAWNRASGNDVGRVVATSLGRDVVSRATIGATVRTGGLRGFGRLGIPNQISTGPWNWIVMNGGANDLAFACGCTACDTTVDLLISADGSRGAIPDLIAQAKGQSARVLWLGYYATPNSRLFGGCRPALVELDRRIALHADRTSGVTFIDAEAVIDPTRPDLFASDSTHPSPNGAELIGQLISHAILDHSED